MTDDRYNRQSLIPDWDQSKIINAKVVILGVGAIGSYVAANLAMIGIGELVLVDFDTIELSNLNRQLLFTEMDIKKNKAETAKIRLQAFNSSIEITAFPYDMHKLSKADLEGTTLIASCLDTFRGRRWANSLAIRENVPMITGGIYAFLGNVQTIIPYQTPCFECQPLISQEKLAQACTPLGDARNKIVLEKPLGPMPAVATMSAIIAGLMTQEIVKLILDIGKSLENYLFYDGLVNSFTSIQLNRNDKCPICSDQYKLETIPTVVFENENFENLKLRIATVFGLADPQLIHRGKILSAKLPTWEIGDKIYATDERLAKPIILQISSID